MRTTVTLDDDVYEAALAHSRATGRRLGLVLSEMARRALQPLPARSRSRGRAGSRRFPSFVVPPDASLILASRIQRALDEDGIV
jgi:hypothetical protein